MDSIFRVARGGGAVAPEKHCHLERDFALGWWAVLGSNQ